MVEKGAKQHCTDYRLCIQHKKHTEDNKAHRKHSHSEGDGHSLKRGKWRAGTLVNGLKVAKIRSNLHTGQSEYAGDCSLWPWPETLDRCCWSHCRSLGLPEINVNNFLCKTVQEGGGGLAVHTSGFNCNWLKVIIVIVKKVMMIVLPAFVGLSISCYTAWYSSTDQVCHDFLQRNPQLSRPVQGSCLCTKGSGSNHRAFYLSSGPRTEERPMWVNDHLRMEFIAECLGKQPAFWMQERPWSPSLSTNLPQQHSVLPKIFMLAPVRRAIAIWSSSELSRFPTLAIGKASDQAMVWLFFCVVSSRHWFQGLGVSKTGT